VVSTLRTVTALKSVPRLVASPAAGRISRLQGWSRRDPGHDPWTRFPPHRLTLTARVQHLLLIGVQRDRSERLLAQAPRFSSLNSVCSAASTGHGRR